MASNTGRTSGSIQKKRNRRKKNNRGSIFAIVALVLISIAGIIAIVFLSKDLLSGDGVNQETTIPFTANVKANDMKTPKGIEITAQEFIDNVDNVPGISCEFITAPDVNVTGTTEVEILVKAADGSSKQFTVELEDETEYEIAIAGAEAGKMKTNLGGKLSVSVELGENPVEVSIKKC